MKSSEEQETSKSVNLKTITPIDLKKFRDEFLSDSVFDLKNFNEIGIKLLSMFWGQEYSEKQFEDIRVRYQDETQESDLPEASEIFYQYVAKKLLRLIRIPRDELFKFQKRIRIDLIAVGAEIDGLIETRNVLEKERNANGFLTADKRYRIKQIDYYLEKNREAKEEIISYIRNSLYPDAIRLSQERHIPFHPIDDVYLYPYASKGNRLFNRYDINSFPEYEGKFSRLPANKYPETIEKLESGSFDFLEFSNWYIETYDLNRLIREFIEKCHFLNDRKDLINRLQSLYKANEYIPFIQMTPIQIEGIFHDCCLAFGVEEKDLEISSINDKLEYINGKTPYFFLYEYFAFRFPVIRNAVAHGKLIEEDPKLLACKLFLDLAAVCEFASSSEIPVIRNIGRIKALATDNNGSNDIKILKEVLLVFCEIPSFYDIENERAILIERLSSDGFWQNINEFIDDNPYIDWVEKAVKAIKNKKIQENYCIEALKKINKLKGALLDH